jgi:hypothetical protein
LSKAKSVGFGFFMGIVPIWGFQLLVGIPLSIVFQNEQGAFPDRGAYQYSAGHSIHYFRQLQIRRAILQNGVQITSLENLTLESIHVNLVQYFLGGTLLAQLAGAVGFVVTYSAADIASALR